MQYFFQSLEEKQSFEIEKYGEEINKRYENWIEDGKPELCVLEYKDEKFEVYCGYGSGSVVVKYKDEIFTGKNSVINENWVVFGTYFGEEVAFVPFVRINKINEI